MGSSRRRRRATSAWSTRAGALVSAAPSPDPTPQQVWPRFVPWTDPDDAASVTDAVPKVRWADIGDDSDDEFDAIDWLCGAANGAGPSGVNVQVHTDELPTGSAPLAQHQDMCCAGVGGACGDVDLQGTTDVHSYGQAFLALNMDPSTVVSRDGAANGGKCSGENFQDFTVVQSQDHAFLAPDQDTRCAAVGGGDCCAANRQSTTDVHSHGHVFPACWGSAATGGECSVVNLQGSNDILSTGSGLFELDQNKSSAFDGGVCGGMKFQGTTEVLSKASLAQHEVSDTGVCWDSAAISGKSSGVNLQGTSHFQSTGSPSLAQKMNSGTGVCWG